MERNLNLLILKDLIQINHRGNFQSSTTEIDLVFLDCKLKFNLLIKSKSKLILANLKLF